MKLVLVALLVLGTGGLVMVLSWFGRKRRAQELADAREEARHWHERLGGQLMTLAGDDAAVKQALADAGERYNAAGAQLERSTSVPQFRLARESALEGLQYVRAARVALGIDPGPDLPPLAGAQRAGIITEDRQVDVGGHTYRASPRPAGQTPYYHPGGIVSGRPVAAGWYSDPWWKTALVAGAWGVGGALVFDALFDGGGWGHHGSGGDSALGFGSDGGGTDGGSDGGFDGGGAGFDGGGFDGGGF